LICYILFFLILSNFSFENSGTLNHGFGVKFKAIELIWNLLKNGAGPSLYMKPRCDSQLLQITLCTGYLFFKVGSSNALLYGGLVSTSFLKSTASIIWFQNVGYPLLLSYLWSEINNFYLQHTQSYIPTSFVHQWSPVNGLSCPIPWVT